MPTFDVSKVDFDPRKHYNGVLMQQGRVLTDYDHNHNEQIEEEEKRRTQVDIIGPYGTPDDGFKIENLSSGANIVDFRIHSGTIYVGGMRLEMDAHETFRLQGDWPQKDDLEDMIPVVGSERFDLVYLEAWQQVVTAVEDGALLDPALGGPDTGVCLRNFRQVKLLKNTGANNCNAAWEALKTSFINQRLGTINDEYERIPSTKLLVSFTNTGTAGDLCFPRETGGYLGAENQAIRVQLAGKDSTGRFLLTWGFDNASPLYRVTVNGVTVTIESDVKDQYHWPLKDQVVEILPASAILSNGEKTAGQSGALRKVALSYDPDNRQFTIDQALVKADIFRPELGLYMRVWNRGSDLDSPAAIPFTPGTPLPLGNTGLQVTISAIGGGFDFVKEDFWVITARPQSPSNIIPWELTISGLRPMGVRRFFAPLAVIRWFTDAGVVKGEILSDCRIPFEPLTERHETCIVAVPGPGWERIFDRFRDGQDICVCFKNALYELEQPVVLRRKGNIKFTGCGAGSRIVVKNNEAAFMFLNCKNLVIRDLSISWGKARNLEDIADREDINGILSVYNCADVFFENITVECAPNSGKKWGNAACIAIKNGVKMESEIPRPLPTDADGNLTGEVVVVGTALRRSSVHIKASILRVGNGQTGVLIVNPERVYLECNRIMSTGRSVGLNGIMIGGYSAAEVHIKDNLVSQMVRGIHIGVSTSRRTSKMAGVVIISGNEIHCTVDGAERRQRHGIFVGNCISLIVRENYILLQRPLRGSELVNVVNGIRIFGYFGKRLMVKDNHLEGFDYFIRKKRNQGIFIRYLAKVPSPRWWIVETNVVGSIRIEGPEKLFRTAKMIYADGWNKL